MPLLVAIYSHCCAQLPSSFTYVSLPALAIRGSRAGLMLLLANIGWQPLCIRCYSRPRHAPPHAREIPVDGPHCLQSFLQPPENRGPFDRLLLVSTRAHRASARFVEACSGLQDQWKVCKDAIPYMEDEFPSAVMSLACIVCVGLQGLLADAEPQIRVARPVGLF